jgi:hypothetical protein
MVVGERRVRPDKNIGLKGNAVPDLNAALDGYTIPHRDIILDECVIANVAVRADSSPWQHVGEGPRCVCPDRRFPFPQGRGDV